MDGYVRGTRGDRMVEKGFYDENRQLLEDLRIHMAQNNGRILPLSRPVAQPSRVKGAEPGVTG